MPSVLAVEGRAVLQFDSDKACQSEIVGSEYEIRIRQDKNGRHRRWIFRHILDSCFQRNGSRIGHYAAKFGIQ